MHSLWMIAVWCFLFGGLQRLFISRRDAAMAASAAFGLVLLVITETLSADGLFYFQPVLIAWIVATGLSAAFCVSICRVTTRPARNALLPLSDPIVVLCAACIALIVGMVGVTAILSPPNNWDAMTYHLARVANWMQHRTVADYPTPILRQLYLGPWAEFAVANIQILVGSDRLANSVQFFAMIGNIIGVTAIAAKLRVSPRGQATAGLFACTIPMLILQASNTQTDCVAALWVVCAIHAGLGHSSREGSASSAYLGVGAGLIKHDIILPFFFGAAIGLAFLTKATTAFVLAPFVAWILLARLRTSGITSAFKLLAIVLTFSLLINAAHFYRNHVAFGRFFSPDAETGWYQNSIHTPGAIVSSIARNILSNTGFRGMHGYPAHATALVKTISGLDPSDPRITYSGTHFIIPYTRDEHDAGNPIHLLLGVVCIAAAVFAIGKNKNAGIYAGCVLCGFFLFCFQLKWQPWITRLQLPFFVILAPLFGLLIDRLRWRWAVLAVGGLLFAQSLTYLLFGFPRPMVGPHNIFKTSRPDLYFSKRPDLRLPYQEAARLIGRSHPDVIALACKGDSWEYAIRSQLPVRTAIFHVGVENQSQSCRPFAPDRQPELLVQLENAKIPAEYLNFENIYRSPGIAVWTRRQ